MKLVIKIALAIIVAFIGIIFIIDWAIDEEDKTAKNESEYYDNDEDYDDEEEYDDEYEYEDDDDEYGGHVGRRHNRHHRRHHFHRIPVPENFRYDDYDTDNYYANNDNQYNSYDDESYSNYRENNHSNHNNHSNNNYSNNNSNQNTNNNNSSSNNSNSGNYRDDSRSNSNDYTDANVDAYYGVDDAGNVAPGENAGNNNNSSAWGNGTIEDITTAQFNSLVANINDDNGTYLGQAPCVVMLWADWCDYCKTTLLPILQKLSKTYKGKVRFYRLSIDNDDSVYKSYELSSLPALILGYGSDIQVSEGAANETWVKKQIDDMLAAK